jgi:F-type H+-transporting ATPase subunit b
MNILADPHSGTYVWYVISFLGFLAIMWKFGKPALLKSLDGRIETIRKEIKTAENLRIEAQELLAQYQRKHRDAIKEADKIIADAKKSSQEVVKQAEKDLAETVAQREAQLEGRIKRMEQSAIQEIQAYATDLAMKAATEIITEKLDKNTAGKLVDQSIKDVADNFH